MTIDWAVLGDPTIIARLVLQVLLLAASAIFSMSETALFSLRTGDLDRIDKSLPQQGARLRALLDEPRQLIVSILCGNELINIAATVNLTGILLALFGNPQAAAMVNTLIMLPLLLIFCEITPKTLAVTAPVPLSTRLIEPVISVWVRVVMPLRVVVRTAADMVTSLFIDRKEREENILRSDQFKVFVRDIESEGVVSSTERRLIVNLIEAGNTPVGQIMVPRPRVKFIDGSLPVAEIVEQFRAMRHRRVPVYIGQRDNIIGVLKEQRLLDVIASRDRDRIEVADLLEPATFVPTTQIVAELAEFFKDGDHHATIVVNEFGGVEGLVSADDVFGYLTMGRAIYLEEHGDIEIGDDGTFRCRGLTPLGALRRATNLPIEETPDVATVGGLIMALARRVPVPGDEVADADVVFRVLSMDRLLVDRVLIAPSGHPSLAPTEAVEAC